MQNNHGNMENREIIERDNKSGGHDKSGIKRSNFGDKKYRLENNYKFLIELGSGSFGSVWRVVEKQTI
jgi:hypothetical protein